MQEKETMQEVYNKLNDNNKDIMLLIAKGMEVAQYNDTDSIKQVYN